MTEGTGTGRLLSIHYLRGAAALMVVAVHCFSTGLVAVPDPARLYWLRHGVELFFLISGFVMAASAQGRAQSPAGFARRRVVRIVPLYWIMTALFAYLAGGVEARRLAASLAFVALPAADGGVLTPVLQLGWTLNFEMFFYSVFALSLLLPRGARIPACTGALLALAIAGAVLPLPQPLAWYASEYLLLFAAGMLAAEFGWRLPAWTMAAGLAALAAGWTVTDNTVLGVFLPALLILLGARSLDGRLRAYRLPVLLGDASYALYLSHPLALQIAFVALRPVLPPLLLLPAVLALAVAIAVLIHRAVELPAGRLADRILRLPRRAPRPLPEVSA